MENICINNGYWGTKVKTDTKEFMFESKVSKASDKYDTNIMIDKERYKVGVGSSDLELNKTMSLTQKVCIEYAIQKASIENNVRVMTAMPINAYKNIEAREAYKKWLLGMNRISYCEVQPEGATAILSDLQWYVGRLVCLVDVGGLTANIMIFDNGKLVPDTAFSCQLGSIILENRIRQSLQQNCLVNVPEYQIKYLLNSDDPVINTVLEEYIADLRQELRKMNYPSTIEYRFTGGGALKFHSLFKQHFNCFISKDAVWENVRGLYLMSKVVWDL